MAIVLPFVCFVAIFLCIGISNNSASKIGILLRSILVFSLTLVVATELLGAFKLISFWGLLSTWGVIAIVSLCYLYLNREKTTQFIQSLNARASYIYGDLSFYERFLLLVLAILFLLEFVQGIVYPPNNLDSMTYHLGRVVSWVSHHSVDPYPTHIVRQLYQPPFAEYVILNFNLLSRGDYFSASVQFFFYLFCLVAIVGIVKSAGLGRIYKIIALVLAATIPEVVMQASSTQNDVVASFFLLSAFYFCLKCIKMTGLNNYLFLGLSVGLAVFTKGTAYMFLAPILLIFGVHVLIKIFQKQHKLLLYAILIVGVLPVLINAAQWYRNYNYSGNLLGVDKSEWGLYQNEHLNPKLFICNTARDIDLNMGLLCVPRITYGAGKVVHKVFDNFGVNIDDPDITFPHTVYIKGIPGDADYYHGLLVATHEDYGANFVHMVIIGVSLLIIAWGTIKHKNNRAIILLAITVIVQSIIFCGYLKFQPWGTRLQTGIFLLSVPVICYAAALSDFFKAVLMRGIIPFILLYAFILILFNYTRPFITCNKRIHGYNITGPVPIFANRFMKIFAANTQPTAYIEYNGVNKDIKSSRYKNIGLMLNDDGWQYPLFTDCYTRELNPININVKNYTKDITGYNMGVDCIISTTTHTPFIDYMGKRFYNQHINNAAIWYYKLRD